MRRFVQFGTICIILKARKHPWRSSTPPKVFFRFFKIAKMVLNRAKLHIYSYIHANNQKIYIAFLFPALHTISICQNCFKCFLGTRRLWSAYYQLMIE